MPDPQWWPVDNPKISAEFGADAAWYQANVGQRGHNGIDIYAAWRTPVYATDDGVVVVEGWNTSWSGAAGGISTIIRHSWGHSGYAHLDSTVIDAGQRVSRGQLIGYMGSTGLATGVHVHFETLPLSVNWANGYAGRVNPRNLINLQPRGTTSGGGSQPSGSGKEYEMIRIQSPGRGIALVGAGYYRHLTSNEEVEQSGPMISAHFSGNDRQFDLWASMSLGGTAANSGADNSIWKFVQDAWKQAHGFFQTLLGREPSAGGSFTDAQIEVIAKRLNENLTKNEYVITGVATPKGK